MGKIICLLGKSGSGKSTIESIIKEVFNLKKIITVTTRPRREKEVDGKDYFFVTDEEFNNLSLNGKLIAHRQFRDWFYAIDKTSIDIKNTNTNYVCAIDLDGFYKIKEYVGEENVLPIYIYTVDRNLIKRMFEREKNPDCKEIIRRFLSDVEMFKDVEDGTELQDMKWIGNGSKFNETIIEIISYIRQELKMKGE